MCLITEQKDPFIAEEDIVIWKELELINDQLCSPYFNGFIYELNKLYETEMVADNIPSTYADNIVAIRYNFASFFNFYEIASKLTNVHQGFHSICETERMKNYHNNDECVVVEGIIPKGSLYYKDATSLIVSNKIILTKIIE